MIRWAGEEKVSVPDGSSLSSEELALFTDGGVTPGTILSTFSPNLLSPHHVRALAEQFGVVAVDIGGVSTIAALADARWNGTLPATIPVTWTLVGSQPTSTGRPNLPTKMGNAAVAITILRRIMGQHPAPTQRQPDRSRSDHVRSLRIKA